MDPNGGPILHAAIVLTMVLCLGSALRCDGEQCAAEPECQEIDVISIVASHSGSVLDVAQDSMAHGAFVHQWDHVHKDNQHWSVSRCSEERGGGENESESTWYQFAAVHSSLCLARTGGYDGALLIQATCDLESPLQRWILSPASSSASQHAQNAPATAGRSEVHAENAYSIFAAQDSGRRWCVEVAGGDIRNGAMVGVVECIHSAPRRTFHLDSMTQRSSNPIITHMFTADPSARFFDDGTGRLWLYASHDPDDDEQWWTMEDYHVFSTRDMQKWTDHGVALTSYDILWEPDEKWLYAPDATYRHGRYYLFFPKTEHNIGVAVSDTPYGPFQDAIGAPLVPQRAAPDVQRVFDPCVFTDDDGTPYLLFGGGDSGGDARIVRLADSLLALDGPIMPIEGAPMFFEAIWLHKRNGVYYLSYSDKVGSKTRISYSVAKNPFGPYRPLGVILDSDEYWTIHHSIVEYRSRWYMFYHRGDGSSFNRRVCVDYLYHLPDGTIRRVSKTTLGVAALEHWSLVSGA